MVSSSWAQPTLSLTSATGTRGGTVSLALGYNDSGASQVAGLQWSIQYTAANVSGVSIIPSSSLTAASKSISCTASSGRYSCLVTGANQNLIPSGQIATLQMTLATNASTGNVSFASAKGASVVANSVTMYTSGATVTVTVPVTTVSALSCAPATITYQGSSICTVQISQAASGAGTSIPISNNSTSVLSAPVFVTVPANYSSYSFVVTGGLVTRASTATLTATLNGVAKTVAITVNPKLTSSLAPADPGTPVIAEGGIVNTASSEAAGPSKGSLAPGSLFSIFGSNLGPDEFLKSDVSPYPTELGGVAVKLVQGQEQYDARLLLASSGQINAILPRSVQLGEAQVVVTNNGRSSDPAPIAISRAHIGVFQQVVEGRNLAVAQNMAVNGSSVRNTFEAPARPGEMIDLFVTGLGSANEDSSAVAITVGGVAAERVMPVRRANPPSTIEHVYFRVPEGSPLGCYVPVEISADGAAANSTTISVTADGAGCK